jgi:hypothetical protein
VYDDQVVIARSNDPIDLDGNGMFDDDAYVRWFVRNGGRGTFQSPAAFTSDNAILAVASVRRGASALCQEYDLQDMYAVIRIPLPVVGACCSGTVCSVGIQTACAGTYKGDGSACLAAGNPITCCRANFDQLNGLQVADIFAFLNAWFAGDLAADFDGGGLAVADIFAFLNAWFAGC